LGRSLRSTGYWWSVVKEPVTETIDYVATDGAGNTATRRVIVEAAATFTQPTRPRASRRRNLSEDALDKPVVLARMVQQLVFQIAVSGSRRRHFTELRRPVPMVLGLCF